MFLYGKRESWIFDENWDTEYTLGVSVNMDTECKGGTPMANRMEVAPGKAHSEDGTKDTIRLGLFSKSFLKRTNDTV